MFLSFWDIAFMFGPGAFVLIAGYFNALPIAAMVLSYGISATWHMERSLKDSTYFKIVFAGFLCLVKDACLIFAFFYMFPIEKEWKQIVLVVATLQLLFFLGLMLKKFREGSLE